MAYWPSNVKYFRTVQVVCVVANFAYRCPQHITPPDGMALLIKAGPLNVAGSLIFVATSQVLAVSADAWPLIPGEVVGYQILDAYEVWVSTNIAGSIVLFSAEQG